MAVTIVIIIIIIIIQVTVATGHVRMMKLRMPRLVTKAGTFTCTGQKQWGMESENGIKQGSVYYKVKQAIGFVYKLLYL